MQEWEKIMNERFGHDNIIALATSENNKPYVRSVNAYYENGAFYIVTYALSNKVKQLESNPDAAVSGEWFTGHGKSANLGAFGNKGNRPTAEKLRAVFAEWINNGHTDLDAPDTIILKIELTDGILFSQGRRFDISFTAKK